MNIQLIEASAEYNFNTITSLHAQSENTRPLLTNDEDVNDEEDEDTPGVM